MVENAGAQTMAEPGRPPVFSPSKYLFSVQRNNRQNGTCHAQDLVYRSIDCICLEASGDS